MKKLFFLCLIALCANAQAQFRISMHTGVGTFQMKDLKELHTEIASTSNLPVALKQVSSFPPYFHFGGSLVYDVRSRLALGARIEYGSSGSRFDYHDYSGYIQSDQLTNYWQFSFSSPYRAELSSKYSLVIDGLPGITYTNLNLKFNEKIGVNESSDNYKFSSINVHVQPTITVVRRFGTFEAGFYGGFCANVLKGKLVWSENKDAHLLNNSGDDVHSDWTGFRAGVQVSCRID